MPQRNQQINLSDTWTLNATTQNEARITYYREGQLTFLAFQRTGAVTDSCTGAAANYCFNGNPDTPLIDDNGNPIATPNAESWGSLRACRQVAKVFPISTSAAALPLATILKAPCHRSGTLIR